MSHKVKLALINNPKLLKSLGILRSKVIWNNMASTVHCLNVIISLQEAINKGREYYKAISEKHLEFDESGKPVLAENGMPKVKDQLAMEADFKELLETEMEICGRLEMGKIHDSKLTAEDLELIRFLFHA